jgi:hypothetical protein
MKTRRTWAIVALTSAGALGATSLGCELMVQLDRNDVVVPEAGCNICSDAGEESGEDSGADARQSDTGVKGSVKDAAASTTDAAGE